MRHSVCGVCNAVVTGVRALFNGLLACILFIATLFSGGCFVLLYAVRPSFENISWGGVLSEKKLE